MNFLNLRNSLALCVFLFFLQLSIIHPVSGRNLVNIQRVTRNDQQYHHQPENPALDVIPTTNEPFVPINDEIRTAVEQETVDSSTGSPIIENDVNPFILVASDGQFADELIPHPVEIVTPSFLDMGVGAIPEGSEPTVKQEDPSVNHQIVEEHFFNNLANSPTEVPENQAQLSFDAAPVDPAVFVPENSPVFTDVSAPVSDESEPIQKIEDLSVINPAVFEVPVSDESAAPIAENPFAEPVVVSVPISDEVEPAQKLEDYSVNPVVGDVRIFIPLGADVPNTDEAITPIEEEPFADPAVAFAPVSDESEPVQKLEDPVTDPLVADVPFSDETVAPIAENPSADPDVVSAPIPAEFEPTQILEDPSVNPAVVDVPISDESAAPIVQNPFVDPVVISAPISAEIEPAHQPEVASVETELESVVQSDPVDLPPSPVFISAVSPAAPTNIAAPQPVSPPVAEKVEINSLAAAATLPKVKNALKSYSTQPKVAQQAVKQDYSKTTRPSVSPTKPQVQYKYHPITSTSPSIAYGPPRITTNNPQSSYEKSSFPTRPFGSSPKPRQLGFPPVASTRDNVLLEVNWDAKLGRPYRQAKLH
ncbi:cytadherence high molecular weight protein 3-like isoform X2 [Daphnia pulicaria]|uniref:cytadherence high molecular weight protein 3-like isoform X2 n=1 Tax=Daphnia pulicaria TaxID=35523 RepID=UPI001EEBE76A|nr:cytadherence high molecular weight protein 3-like isoform X2 [Daphnia pulicaria]